MKEIEMLEMLGITNLSTLFLHLSSEDTNSIMYAGDASLLVESELKRIYDTDTFLEYEDDLFDYLAENINRVRCQIDSGVLSYPKKRKHYLNRLSQKIFHIFDKKIKPASINCFTRLFAPEEQKKLFSGLVNGGYLPTETIYSHFCYVFGSISSIPNNEKPFMPLQWVGTVSLLAYFIENVFGDTDSKNLWEITINCFLWNGNKPNKNTLKSKVSEYKNDFKEKPKGHEKIDAIINSI
jgi:hypothetical protein